MNLEVIGAGFGRTGTMSLKVALEELGFGPCYHMREVFEHPEHIELWGLPCKGSRSIGSKSSATTGHRGLARMHVLQRAAGKEPQRKGYPYGPRSPEMVRERLQHGSIGFRGLFTQRSSTWPAWSCPLPGKLIELAGSSASSYGRGISAGGSRNESTPSRSSSGTMRRSSSVYRQRGF